MLKIWLRKILKWFFGDSYIKTKVKLRNKQKVFVIGMNKTGTTSLEYALKEQGYILGRQRTAELLLDDLIIGNYDSLINFCKTAEAFQDFPFSVPGVYKKIHEAFPNSKFILSHRDTPEQWFNSLVNFHSKIWGNGKIPTDKILKQTSYVYLGYPWKSMQFLFGNKIYDKSKYCEIYQNHISDVTKFFDSRTDQLLMLNVANEDSYTKFCHFLNLVPMHSSFGWLNKT